MTLIEILGIVVILGLACVIGASSLARKMQGDPIRDTIGKIAIAWHRFHEVAIERGGGVVEVSGGRMRMQARRGAPDEVVFEAELQVTWWTGDGRQTSNRLIFDAQGRSADLLVRLRYGGQTDAVFISGLTGAIRPAGASLIKP